MLTVPALTLRFRSRYPAVPPSVRAIRSEVDEIARDCGADRKCLEAVRLAVSEASRDAVSRGAPGTHVRVSIELGDRELVVTVRDDAAGGTELRTGFPCTLAVEQEHDSAVERLEAALVEQGRLAERFDSAVGTATEPTAYARLQTAGDHVAARQAWVHWVEDSAYRGLNAGPFELRSDGDASN